jgi:hypothetical protein
MHAYSDLFITVRFIIIISFMQGIIISFMLPEDGAIVTPKHVQAV